MKARRKWDLSVLNSKDYENLLVSNPESFYNFTPYRYRKISLMRQFKLDLIQYREYNQPSDDGQ